MQEAERYKEISEVKECYLKVREAAEILGLSQRQIYRIKARVEKEGMGGIIHGKIFQIMSNEYRKSFYKAKVEVHEYLDGSINIFYKNKRLKHKPISKEKIKSLPPSGIEQKDYELITTFH